MKSSKTPLLVTQSEHDRHEAIANSNALVQLTALVEPKRIAQRLALLDYLQKNVSQLTIKSSTDRLRRDMERDRHGRPNSLGYNE